MENRKASRKDVARLAGVSEATVSYVLNHTKKVTADVQKRVESAAAQLNYTPNLIAKSLATSSTHHVALLVDNLKNPHFCELLEGAQSVASKNGYIVSVIAADTSDMKSIAELVGRGVDGIINTLRFLDLKRIFKISIPTVAEGTHLKRDYFPAMNEAVSLLKKNGHRKIAFLSGLPLNLPEYGRLTALKKALKENGLDADESLFIENKDGYLTDESAGAEMAETLLKQHKAFSAVIAINDLVAIGAARRFSEFGFKIPDDISIVGCDNLKILEFLPTAISSIDTDSFRTGEILMEALISEIGGKAPVIPTFICRFVNRESISKIPIEGESL